MGLRSFEQRLEHLVEGTFARVFKSGVTPLEVAQRITRAMDDNRSAGVDGGAVVPNQFWIYLSPEDFSQFSEVAATLTAELADAAREHARDESYSFMGPVKVDLVLTEEYPTGAFEMVARLREGPMGRPPGSLILSSGERVRLGVDTVTIGRVADNTLMLPDPNVSRFHAQVRAVDGGYRLVDMGSTNGTAVNGARVADHLLEPGDEIYFGSTRVAFEAS